MIYGIYLIYLKVIQQIISFQFNQENQENPGSDDCSIYNQNVQECNQSFIDIFQPGIKINSLYLVHS